MFPKLARASRLAWLGIIFWVATQSIASASVCEEDYEEKGRERANSYLYQPVKEISPAAIADEIMKAPKLKKLSSSTLRQMRKTIIALETSRPSPKDSARILSRNWSGTRARAMTREQHNKLFLQEVERRQKKGIQIYGATLQAAQAVFVRIADLTKMTTMGNARAKPDSVERMWYWDNYLRQHSIPKERAAILAMPKGMFALNNVLVRRRGAIEELGTKAQKNTLSSKISRLNKKVNQIAFPTIGYSNPKFFQAIFDGCTKKMRFSAYGVYFTSFFSMFRQARDAPECRNVVSEATLARIGGAGSSEMLKKIFGGLVKAHKPGANPVEEGAKAIGSMAVSEASAKADARHFYKLNGCTTPRAKRFFANVEVFSKQK